MNWRTLNSIISAASVVIMFIWGWLDTFAHSWIAVMIGGMAVGIIASVNTKKEKEEKKRAEEDQAPDGEA